MSLADFGYRTRPRNPVVAYTAFALAGLILLVGLGLMGAAYFMAKPAGLLYGFAFWGVGAVIANMAFDHL